MFETEDGVIDTSNFSVVELEAFKKKYPNAKSVSGDKEPTDFYSGAETYSGFLPEKTQTPEVTLSPENDILLKNIEDEQKIYENRDITAGRNIKPEAPKVVTPEGESFSKAQEGYVDKMETSKLYDRNFEVMYEDGQKGFISYSEINDISVNPELRKKEKELNSETYNMSFEPVEVKKEVKDMYGDYIGLATYEKVYPYAKELDQIRTELTQAKKSGGKLPDDIPNWQGDVPPQELVQEVFKRKYKETELGKFKNAQYDKWAASAPEGVVEATKIQEEKMFSSGKRRLQQFENNYSRLTLDAKSLDELEIKIANKVKNKETITLDEVSKYNNLRKSIEKDRILVNNQYEEMPSVIEELDDISEELVALKKDYSILRKGSFQSVSTLGDLVYGLGEFAEASANLAGNLAIDDFEKFNAVSSAALERRKEIAKQREKFRSDVEFKDAFTSPENLARFLTEETFRQLPIFAAIGITGGAGSLAGLGARGAAALSGVTIGAMSAGQQIGEMSYEEFLNKYNDIQKYGVDLEYNNKDRSDIDKYLVGLGFGAAEGLFSVAPTYILGSRFFKNATKTLANNGMQGLLTGKPATRMYRKQMLKEFALGGAGEGITEGLTQLSQNIITKNPNIWEGVDHAIFSGGFFGSTLGSGSVAMGAAARTLMPDTQKAEVDGLSKKLRNLRRSYASLDKRTSAAKIVKQQIEDTNNQVVGKIEDFESNLRSNFSYSAFESYKNAFKNQSDLRVQAVDVQNSDLSNAEKKEIIKDLAIKYETQQSAIEQFKRSINKFDLLKVEDKTRFDRIKKQAENKLKSEGLELESGKVNKDAYEIYLNEEVEAKTKAANGALKNSGIDYESFNFETEKEAIVEADRILKDDKASEDKKSFWKEIKKSPKGALNGLAGNVDGKYTYLSIKETQIKNERAGTASHETSHGILWASLLKGNLNFDAIAEEISTYLKQENPQIYSEMFGMVDPSQRVEVTKEGVFDSEEIVVGFMERIGRISKNKKVDQTFLYKLGRSLSNIIGGKADLSTQPNIVSFLSEMATKIDKGTFTKEDLEIARESDVLKEYTRQGVKPETKKSLSLLDNVNNLVPKDVKTKEEFQSRKVFNPIFNATQPGGVIYNYVKSRALSGEEASIMLEGVVDRLINYNPAAVRKTASGDPITFGEFIFANTRFSKLDAKKRLAIESERRAESLDTEEARQVAEPVAETTTTEAPRVEYKNLVESKVLPTEMVAKVQDKILITTKTLKSRIDAATSINKTVTPLMSEIKKEIGKQADIEFKKMLGAKRGGELRNNFLKLKKPILENMTTTWLMQGMPFAIQKSVDGKFTSDWEGKKIDRESVGTDKAGRTSGAQLVRRLPNAANKITDEQFLTYMFKGDEVIRGRKEALAKALAEEYAFDVYSQELYDGNSEIRKAFEDNQERLGVELSNNFVQEFNKQAERGNVKRSISQTQMQEVSRLTRAVQSKGYDNVVEDKNIIDDDLSNVSKESIELLTRIWNEGLIVDFGTLGFLKGIKSSNIIPESIKELSKKAVTKVSSKQVKDALAKDSKKIAMKLGSDIINITGLDGLGFHYRILDPAATKKDKITKQLIPGVTGEYFDVADSINKNIKPSKNLPKNLDLSKVRLMNSSMGLMSKINTILNKNISAEEKQKQYKKYIPEIQEANIHNKILANHIIKTMVDMVKNGEITPQSYIGVLQLQTQAAKGLRALTGLKYITFKNGPQGKIKGEHLADNSTSMLELAELAFSDLNKNQLNNSINDILEFHDQWLENKNTLDFVDVFGRNNPFKDKRINILPAAQQKFVFTFDLMPAATLIDSRSKTIDNLVKIRKGQAEQAKISIKQKALNNARKRSYSENSKGISVYDFDDTLAFSKSQIIVKKDGKTFKINAAQFAKQGETLLAEGAEFDFSEFNKVVKGQPGPLIPRIQKAIDKFGNNNIFILTARPVASESAIHAFMKGLGIDIPRANITGLANSTAQAKADWMVGKVAEGFNDFYFVDDAIKNVQAVKDVLETFDVNSKVQQAIANRKRSMSADLNEMIERNKGVRAETTYSKVLARKKGAKKGKFKFFVPYSAEDFKGLTSYTLAGKGKQGEADQKLFDKALILPYTRGIAAMEGATQALKNDYKNLLDMFGIKKELPKKIGDTGFTTDQAVRVYLWDKQGFDIPNISKRDQNKLSSLVSKDPDLVGFAEGLMAVSKKDNWVNPKDHWDVGSILKDLNDITDNVNRKEYLAEFIENVDEMFDETTLNKLEAIYGTNYVDALQDSIRRMKSGSNTPRSAGKIEQKWLNWVNNSVGTIMFFNRRSALLQMLSFTNFINWSDNNPAKAAAAFANQPLYWKKWTEIFNSDKLKERRGGLKSDIQESEIANQARNSKDKAAAVVSYLLKIGFTPTQIADSFAIATGGATFLINRTKKYEKQGLSKKEAEAKAFEDFGRISDETQQSGDPMLISQQQSSHLGRLILAFQNTPMQYTRLMKKAGKDIINRRGSDVENLSKIAYYGFVQNLVFSSLQSALFALIPGFDDEEEDDAKLEDKAIRTANSMVDTILRGSGLAGAVISTLKNAIMRYQKEDKKAQERYGGGDQTYTMLELANISPPIGSKLRKVYSAIQTKKFNQAAIDEMGYDLTRGGRLNPSPNYEIIANISSAVGNLPLDRLLSEVKSINEAFDSRNTSYQRLALALGWRTWDVNVKNEEQDLIKNEAKKRKKEASKQRAKVNRNEKSREKRRKKELEDRKKRRLKEIKKLYLN